MSDVRSLLQSIFDHPAFRGACSAVAEAGSEVAVSGLTRPAKALVVAGLAHELRRPLVVLTADTETADHLRQATSVFVDWLEGKAAATGVNALPAFDCSPYEGRSPHPEVLERRAVALWNLTRGRACILFTPLPAALARFRESSFYRSLALELKVGDELNLDDLVEHLAGVGYESGEPVSNVGQYSVRGGIVDVFSPESEWPFRIEFFGDRIESAREFDPGTQRSRKPVPCTVLLPLAETTRSPKFFAALIRALSQRGLKQRFREAEPDWAPAYSTTFPGWEFFVPLVEPHPNTLLSLFNQPLLVWDEPLERKQQLKRTLEGWAASFEEVHDAVPLRPRPEEIFLTEAEFIKLVEGMPQVALKELAVEVTSPFSLVSGPLSAVRGEIQPALRQGATDTSTVGLLRAGTQAGEPREAELSGAPDVGARRGVPLQPTAASSRREFTLPTQPAPRFHGLVKTFIEDIRGRLERCETVAFVMPSGGKIERLREILTEYEVPHSDVKEPPVEGEVELAHLPGSGTAEKQTADQKSWSALQLRGGGAASGADIRGASRAVLIARGDLEEGIAFPELRLVFLSDSDLFGDFVWGTPRQERSATSSFLFDLSDLRVGDYVVHVDHGIGLYHGLRQLEVEGARRDFMLLTYQEEAKLYVPLERLDLVEKYRGSSATGEGSKPTLDRLGGATWARTKTRVKRALRDIAEELLRLYAERKMHGGVAYSADAPWQREFEDAFEFEETPDQLTALADIKHDLERPEPMDRLLCGDVGYGKTELAMRAAFKVVQDSKQVAVLAPTTVLVFQHFTTFRQRMTPFPVGIEMLSRFRSAAEQKKILAETEAGKVDILIGTHRLLSKDVRFRDLGLLVVDEEQRFGVAAKEKLKQLKAGVEVLTMSATPIPRTLHMSLGGLRDLSVIETPPRGRLAIQTVVAPFSQGLIQAAILQEMERQGQTYFVHNRVESIFSMAALLQRLVPTARLGVAHGQMGERELERVMLKFIQGGYDVLVSTALIENGLDIPRANTMIVNHADRFGLADLYQLRGRVGRSNRRAYAYLLIPAEESLTPTARHRLAALQEFSGLGAGFRLAALDLELRGAGNLLGAEQSGHLNALGLDLYLQMLEQTVDELKGATPKPEVRTTLNLGLDIKIPDTYVADESQRLRMYKRISSLSTPESRADLEAELIDRYGAIPSSVSNLLSYALLKSVAEQLLVQSIERKSTEVWLRFHAQAPVSPEKLTRFIRRYREASFRPDGLLRFRLAVNDGDLVQQIQNILRELQA